MTETFVRIEGTRQFRLTMNGLRQFKMIVYCADGGVCEYGPFGSGEEAAKVQADLESGAVFNGCEYIE